MSRKLLSEELSDKIGVAAKTCKMTMKMSLEEEEDMVRFGVCGSVKIDE